jgi:hypothetical protein
MSVEAFIQSAFERYFSTPPILLSRCSLARALPLSTCTRPV